MRSYVKTLGGTKLPNLVGSRGVRLCITCAACVRQADAEGETRPRQEGVCLYSPHTSPLQAEFTHLKLAVR